MKEGERTRENEREQVRIRESERTRENKRKRAREQEQERVRNHLSSGDTKALQT